MILRQLFDRESCTYTYLLADDATRDAIIIDPVIDKTARDLALIHQLGLTLRYTLDTHVHADHITGSGLLAKETGAKIVSAAVNKLSRADVQARNGETIKFGAHILEVLSTPGHTSGCLTFVINNDGKRLAFTGDALFVRGCGRTDFQQGSPADLYNSIHEKVYTLGDETIIYPGHDYNGHTKSTVQEEKAHNPRLKVAISKDEFVHIMDNLNLAYPKHIKVSLPANLQCGLTIE
jgi:sulfur dioxygenase